MDIVYVVLKYGKRAHKEHCRYIKSAEKIDSVIFMDAAALGLAPCKVCYR